MSCRVEMAEFPSSPFYADGSAPPVSPGCTSPRRSISAPVVSPNLSPSWLQDPMHYTEMTTPPAGILESTNVTPEQELVILHVSFI